MRETIDEKADRLLGTGSVRIVRKTPAEIVALVDGDHARYIVSAGVELPMACTCPAAIHHMRCSHLLAVERVTTARYDES